MCASVCVSTKVPTEREGLRRTLLLLQTAVSAPLLPAVCAIVAEAVASGAAMWRVPTCDVPQFTGCLEDGGVLKGELCLA